jgi:hypothetical protein
MNWFRNYYRCDECGYEWMDEWSGEVDDDCRKCGARHMSAYESDDLTEASERDDVEFVVLCPNSAGDEPAYRELRRFDTPAEAEAFLDGAGLSCLPAGERVKIEPWCYLIKMRPTIGEKSS